MRRIYPYGLIIFRRPYGVAETFGYAPRGIEEGRVKYDQGIVFLCPFTERDANLSG